MKCICCKFDNCKKEFEKHRSNTSFSALDAQFSTVAELIHAPEAFVDKVCLQHVNTMKTWLDGVFVFYDSLKGGVMLTKVKGTIRPASIKGMVDAKTQTGM